MMKLLQRKQVSAYDPMPRLLPRPLTVSYAVPDVTPSRTVLITFSPSAFATSSVLHCVILCLFFHTKCLIDLT